MNRSYILVLFFSLSLACNNYCNGHGKCGSGDKCACFMGWGGADCSLRSCPFDDAFVDVPLGDINHDGQVDDKDGVNEWRPNGGISENLNGYVTATRAHRYAECSNAGLCNRENGECECFPGYEGSACQRRSCPTAVENAVCSGHGSCSSSTAVIYDSSNGGSGSYYGWESEKYMSCVCDKGWEGIDCNLRKCPKGSDPVTVSESDYKEFSYSFSASQIYDGTIVYYLKIVYDGIEYSTPSFSKANMATTCSGTDYAGNIEDPSQRSYYSEEIRRAVSNIPAFSKATVDFICPGGSTTVANIKITLGNTDIDAFLDSKIYACQEGLACNTPLSTGTGSPNKDLTKKPDSKPSGTDADIANNNQYLCSRRGRCNSDTGECECFPGYSGEACQNQRSIAL